MLLGFLPDSSKDTIDTIMKSVQEVSTRVFIFTLIIDLSVHWFQKVSVSTSVDDFLDIRLAHTAH